MLIGNFYVKPLYLIIAVAIILIFLIFKIAIKIFSKIILVIIVILASTVANKYFNSNKLEEVARSLYDKSNYEKGYEKIKELYNKGEIIPNIDDIKVKINDVWIGINKIKDNLVEKDGKTYIDIDGKQVEVRPNILEIITGETK